MNSSEYKFEYLKLKKILNKNMPLEVLKSIWIINILFWKEIDHPTQVWPTVTLDRQQLLSAHKSNGHANQSVTKFNT